MLATQSPILADSKSVAGVKGTDSERTFIMIKPDGMLFMHNVKQRI